MKPGFYINCFGDGITILYPDETIEVFGGEYWYRYDYKNPSNWPFCHTWICDLEFNP